MSGEAQRREAEIFIAAQSTARANLYRPIRRQLRCSVAATPPNLAGWLDVE